jgi:peptidoglycan hydrolase-like amidase
LLFSASLALGQPLRIGVFSLFKPEELSLTAAGTSLVVVSGGLTSRLEGSQSMVLYGAARVTATPQGGAVTFVIGIPGKIQRRFHGTLVVQRKPDRRYLEAIVTMDLEQAVASAVAAETVPGTGLEALRAQAVVARSYYLASPTRHRDYDACDSTHCQFLRELPPAGSAAAKAARDTAGMVLSYQGRPVAALYSASCGGSTRPLDDPGANYPYFAVDCEYCRRHRPGVVEGHRYGLCQRGAAGLADSSDTFREILSHYYPGTTLQTMAFSPGAPEFLEVPCALARKRPKDQ